MEIADRADPVTGRPHATRTLWSLRCLRGVAALMIVVGHAQTVVALRTADQAFRRSTVLPWGASVDLFFVLSGFLMVHASHRLFGTADGPRRFLLRRLARVVPLYWLATGAMLLLLVAGSLKGGDRFPGPVAIAASLAFVPYSTWGDRLFPLIDLGWTLNYELFFYLVFAPFVALPWRGAVLGLATTLVGVVALGTVLPPGSAFWFWSRPIVLDFVLGAGVGTLVAQGCVLPGTVRVVLMLGSLIVFVTDPSRLFAGPIGATVANEWPRVLWAGLPCAGLVAGATLGDEAPLPMLLRPVAVLGDASYSLYLLHPFVLIGLEKVMQKFAFMRTVHGALIVVVAVGAAVLLALAAFRSVERPLTGRLTERLGRPRRRRRSVAVQGRSA